MKVTNFSMSDISAKIPSQRSAIAQGRIRVNAEAFELIKTRKLKKGDALILAEIAGINGAKKASDMILLCHPINIDHIKVAVELEEKTRSILIYALVSTLAKTGVEMEAVAAVNSALLTIYDLSKMVDPAPEIYDIRLLFKKGGKKGVWTNPTCEIPDWIKKDFVGENKLLSEIKVAVITASDRAAEGVYEDESGKLLQEIFTKSGAKIISYEVVKDEEELIFNAVKKLLSAQEKPQLIVTTGGTGISKRDVTPEILQKICQKILPGIGELLRINGAKFTPHSWSSRSVAGVVDDVLIISLPGNPKAVQESCDCLLPLLPHLVATIAGKKH